MARKNIEAEYTVEDGIIKDLGKFEGEMLYAPYFYEAASDGDELSYFEDGLGEYASLVEVTDDDRREFPEIDADTVYILVTESEIGFVCCEELTAARADKMRASYEEFNASYGEAASD